MKRKEQKRRGGTIRKGKGSEWEERKDGKGGRIERGRGREEEEEEEGGGSENRGTLRRELGLNTGMEWDQMRLD